MSQAKYIKDILEKFGMSDASPCKTPMPTKIVLTEDTNGIPFDPSIYRSMIGSLLYLCASRLDIMFSVCEVDDRLAELVDEWDAEDAHSPAALAIRAEVAKLCSRRKTLGRAAARLFRSIPAVDVPGLEAITSSCSSEGDADISALRARFNG